MFSILDMINQFLGYVNMNAQVKNRIYSIVGGLGLVYLYYVAVRFLINQYLLRGSAILLVAIVLSYYLYLNVYYFFSHHQAPFDISPRLARLLHIKGKVESPAQQQINQIATEIQNAQMGDLNGHFEAQHVLPVELVSTENEVRNINLVASEMHSQRLLQTNYGHQSKQQIRVHLEQNGDRPIYAIGKGALIPYFGLHLENGQYVAYAGLNIARRHRVGVMSQVGLQSIDEIIAQHVRFYPASLVLVGGDYKTLGRNEILDHRDDYSVRARVAFQK